jgi:hypothetical protein
MDAWKNVVKASARYDASSLRRGVPPTKEAFRTIGLHTVRVTEEKQCNLLSFIHHMEINIVRFIPLLQKK